MKGPTGRAAILARLALSIGVIFGGAMLLEGVLRIAVPAPTPWRIYGRHFHHSLPIVNGAASRGWPTPEPPQETSWLSEAKEPGELRIFVFGESSVQGAPWGEAYAAPVMLSDLLAEALPGRPITVVNMGRGSTMTIDSYYYLVGVARFAPDLVIFYQGVNDRFDADPEMCAPVLHPTAHRTWRWLVERSHLLWTARVRGPAWYRSLIPADQRGTLEVRTDACPPRDGFRAWTKLLVHTASAAGARVIVTTPVASDLWNLDEDHGPAGLRPVSGAEGKAEVRARQRHARLADAVERTEGPYREMLGCWLDAPCQATLRGNPSAEFLELTAPMRAQTEMLADSWRAAAAEVGGQVVEFNALLRARSEAGLILPPVVQDAVHLSLDGYWLLAWSWARAVEARLQDRPLPPLDPAAVPQPQGSRYLSRMNDDARKWGLNHCQRLAIEWRRWMNNRLLFTATSIAENAWAACQEVEARDVLDWLRRRLADPAGRVGEGAQAGDLDIEPLLVETRGQR